jgi:hypothetical protein
MPKIVVETTERETMKAPAAAKIGRQRAASLSRRPEALVLQVIEKVAGGRHP